MGEKMFQVFAVWQIQEPRYGDSLVRVFSDREKAAAWVAVRYVELPNLDWAIKPLWVDDDIVKVDA